MYESSIIVTGLTGFYRYWNSKNVDHFYTTNIAEIGTGVAGTRGRHGYISEGTQCRIYKSRKPGTVPLYRYYNSHVCDHFYTTNSHEIGTTTPGRYGKHKYKSEGIAGYCYPRRVAGTVPLYRYWKSAVADHFYTTNKREIGTAVPGRKGKHGYYSEGVACYVRP